MDQMLSDIFMLYISVITEFIGENVWYDSFWKITPSPEALVKNSQPA